MHSQLILIIDCGSQYTQLIARKVRASGVYCEIVPANTSVAKITEISPAGIIVSGSPDSINGSDSVVDSSLVDVGIPILGICFGMQLLLSTGGITIADSFGGEFGAMEVFIEDANSPLFASMPSSFIAWMSHSDSAQEIDPKKRYRRIAYSQSGVAAVEHAQEKIFAVQFHPEVDHTEYGDILLRNFTHGICGCSGEWQMDNIADKKITSIRDKLQNDTVLLALSGGVDSSVVAALLHKAVDKQLVAVFVDNGLLRQGEAEQVRHTFENEFAINLRVIDARDIFFSALQGIEDPEQKRTIIGNTFIDIFEQEADAVKDCKWLAQGTIYPDVIESADNNTSSKAKVIKSHHNVGGLPSTMRLKLIEPLRDLFKDEVRELGEKLGLSKNILYRHPFPGPGLAVRIIGEVKPEFVEIVRNADNIFIQELKAQNYYDKVNQAFVVFLPIKSVGVKGDNRAYEYVVSLRAVETIDFMTARVAQLPHDFLQQVATKIINQVSNVTRVCYDISSKPPATIEWE